MVIFRKKRGIGKENNSVIATYVYSSFMQDAFGSAKWSYDARGRIIAETQVTSGTGSFVTNWNYNAADMPTKIVYPGGKNNELGEVVDYSYNNQMALERIFSEAYSTYYLQDTHYDAAGRVTWRAMGANNLGSNPMLESNIQFYDWDEQGGRLHLLQTGTYTNTTSLLNLVYDYDQVGNVDTIQDYTTGNPQTQSYEYDALNRLLSASTTNGTNGHGIYSESYSYDATTGNPSGRASGRGLASKTGLGSYTYDPNHPHAVASTASGWSYSYDDNGNQVQRVISDTFDLKYDAENRLIEVKKNNAVIATFVYNGDGERVKGTVDGGVMVSYVGNYVEWRGSQLTRYYYAGATRLAMRRGSEFQYLFGDHLGSTSKSYNVATGGITTLLYTAWGSVRYSVGGTMPTKYHFTGQYEQAEIGLYYYGARWYDPSLSRWVQPDSIIPDPENSLDLDRYVYVRNNPLAYIDPDGHDPITVIALIGFFLFISQIPSDQYQTNPENWGDAGVQWIGIALMAGKLTIPAACADMDCTDEAQDILTKSESAILEKTGYTVGDLAETSTQNPEAQEVVIGLFKNGTGYTAMGSKTGASYLDMPSTLWGTFQKYSLDFWKVNEQFLKNAIEKGKVFILETPYKQILKNPNSNV